MTVRPEPEQWLVRARSNLLHARHSAVGVLFEDRCYDAQQSAEKALKAVLIALGEEFPYTHSLDRLIALIEERGIALPDAAEEVSMLTLYAVETRYPAALPSVTEAEWVSAVNVAAAIVLWAEQTISELP